MPKQKEKNHIAEPFATAVAVAQLLEQSIQLLSRIRRAAIRAKNLPTLIQQYTLEVTQTKSIVDLAVSEPALRTPNVAVAIDSLRVAGEALKAHLVVLGDTRGLLRDFVRAFVRGQRDAEKLEGLMGELARRKGDLGMYVQLANVGLTRRVGERLGLGVDVGAVEAVGRMGRARGADGIVMLTEEDIAILARPELTTPENNGGVQDGKKEDGGMASHGYRRVAENEASGDALQVNTPVGSDVWKGVGSVTIEKNKASGNATQWNYPIESVETFLATLDRRKPPSPQTGSA
ncbi:hypothetical protein QBC34DRAFT_419955 [Podospora aff. communis PSN243]|uniref:NACHT-NTPase and P-loop NTPases N-terminal domain-containing protein n=1 Tax=Podospora aff. communis PSN243 TaxID=3040156 RepID=A0AAV9H8K0_9PEZI|nr:hypothetical protein QBC34DRAFT_419955 [Podospora aff. communis PSN243]